jgi:signal transduction histidine kinase
MATIAYAVPIIGLVFLRVFNFASYTYSDLWILGLWVSCSRIVSYTIIRLKRDLMDWDSNSHSSSHKKTNATDYVIFSVADTGIGIRHDDMGRIFTPFEQADNSVGRQYQGTGLGLTLTKRLVELQDGRLWAESPGVGKGSKFSFMIPISHGDIAGSPSNQ